MLLNGFRVRQQTPPFRVLVIPAPQFVIPAKAGIQGGVWVANDPQTLPPGASIRCPAFSYLGVPAFQPEPLQRLSMKACPGLREGGKTNWRSGESTSRTPIRGRSRHPGVGNPVAPELLSSQGSPTRRDFHPLMRPSQGHGDSGERWNPEGEGKGKTMAILAIDAVWALRLRQLAELARPYTKTTQRRGTT